MAELNNGLGQLTHDDNMNCSRARDMYVGICGAPVFPKTPESTRKNSYVFDFEFGEV